MRVQVVGLYQVDSLAMLIIFLEFDQLEQWEQSILPKDVHHSMGSNSRPCVCNIAPCGNVVLLVTMPLGG